MVIAVNTRFLLSDSLEGFGYFTREVFREIVLSHPEHKFYFLFDRPFNEDYVFAPNVKALVVGPPARHPVLWKYWYDFKIPAVLKRIRADVFISPDGYCSLGTVIPQCMVVHDLGFLHHPGGYKSSHLVYLKHYLPKFLKKARTIATVSEFSKKDIINQYHITDSKIDVVYSAPKPIFQPLEYGLQEVVREKYTGGQSYFIYVGAIHPRKNLVNLLKAFSIFKKRQQSSMKLVLAGRLAWKNEEFMKLMRTYKYREEVILTGYLEEEELVKLVASAYALVYPSFFEGFGVPVLEAMKSHVPVLTSKDTSMQEIGEDAALYFDPADFGDMADKMMLIYKDEDLRQRLIGKGKPIAEKYTWKRTAQLVWKAIERTVERENKDKDKDKNEGRRMKSEE